MAERPDLIVVDEDGTLRVAGRGAARRLRDRAGRYRLTVDAPGLLVMRREPERPPAGGARVLMAGEIVGRMTVLEIINVIANAGWRGELHVFGADDDGGEPTHRVLVLDQGALKYTRSEHPDDRLGEVLYRHGVVSRDQLTELLRDTTPDKRFGQLCVERGLMSQDDLFQELQRQAEQIFFAALLEDEGHYVFARPDESAPPPAHTLHLPVQGLLMEGVQRIDEMALFRERIRHDGLIPAVRLGRTARDLDQTDQTVMAYCDGERSIAQIARESGLGEFLTTKSIYRLMQAHLVELREGAEVDAEQVRQLVSAFNEVMRDIFAAVATYGGVNATRETLSAWIGGSGYASIFGDVDEDGTIDVATVTEGLCDASTDNPLEALHQALHQLAAFALFSATTTLPRDQELVLARDVNRRLKAIRLR